MQAFHSQHPEVLVLIYIFQHTLQDVRAILLGGVTHNTGSSQPSLAPPSACRMISLRCLVTGASVVRRRDVLGSAVLIPVLRLFRARWLFGD